MPLKWNLKVEPAFGAMVPLFGTWGHVAMPEKSRAPWTKDSAPSNDFLAIVTCVAAFSTQLLGAIPYRMSSQTDPDAFSPIAVRQPRIGHPDPPDMAESSA